MTKEEKRRKQKREWARRDSEKAWKCESPFCKEARERSEIMVIKNALGLGL